MNLTKINTNLDRDINLVYVILIPKNIEELSCFSNHQASSKIYFLANNYKNFFIKNIGYTMSNKPDSMLIEFLRKQIPELLFDKVIQEYELQETSNYMINIGGSRYSRNTEYWQEVLYQFNKLYTIKLDSEKTEEQEIIDLFPNKNSYNFIKKQEKLFNKIDKEILAKYKGKFVYVEDGIILDSDFIREILIKRVIKKVGYKDVFITEIKSS